jgi:spore maturation protein CgeB
MRIFLVLHPAGNINVPGSSTWMVNLHDPLIQMGHEVILFRLDKAADDMGERFRSSSYRSRLGSILLSALKESHNKQSVDFFLSYVTNLDLGKEILGDIKKLGIPMANFSCNNTHQFHLVRDISKFYDINLYSEKSAISKFKEIGANSFWFQLAANPSFCKSYPTLFKYDLSFAGMNYAKRPFYIAHLLRNNFDVHCFGPGWVPDKKSQRRRKIKRILYQLKSLVSSDPEVRLLLSSWLGANDLHQYLASSWPDSFHPPLSDEQMIRLFSSTRINLGFLEVYAGNNLPGSGLDQHLHLREFEVPMCGGLYATNYSEELAEHFEPDKEVIVFRNEHELADKTGYFLRNPIQAERIRKAGFNRAHQCHTWTRRFDSLFSYMGLK